MGTQFEPGCPRFARRAAIGKALGVAEIPPPRQVTRGRRWIRDGVRGVELTWNDTSAWLLTPQDAIHPLPAILLMHGHDGVKFYGKEKVADGPDGVAPGIAALREHGYDGTAPAAGLVAAGFAVLVHDVFPWGSRRVPWEQLPERARRAGAHLEGLQQYEAAAREHEHGLAKVAALRGTSLAGRILTEDLTALHVLSACAEVDPDRIATAGFSGGGARVAHLLASSDRLRAGVITASMSTYADIADGHADDTSWLMITAGLPAVCDWPEIAGSAAPTPLLVQFAEQDSHFGPTGMRDAEASLRRDYGNSTMLLTQWFSEPHRFTAAMQDAAANWLSLHV
ncbi:hypothetical protein CH274_11765 [Rhodococcus sp. 06-418-5]|uniref:hypothetical protein n=1 Tax=Rhodococcus sp. 06-418-5 TaxID=2022507 RepID=UPI000B9C61F1|nr:hypothetical protein [Rhodococcus sp. 06-418-5]OZC81468.1 hypothetical protein CH274_11765 [Rhodococcus sp. 06-418-5]